MRLISALALLFVVLMVKIECRSVDSDQDKELIQTHVIFRHGERTTYKFYPNDPYINKTFYPMGLGGLTNNGKLGEFRLGEFLRKEYNSLLSDIYLAQEVEARSTHTTRTLMSAQLVLAGLYPPAPEQQWHSALCWQPIPVFSRLLPEEDLLHPEVCPKKLAYYDDLPNQEKIHQAFIKPNEKLFQLIEEKSGMQIRNPHDLLEFYFIVNTEDDLHLNLPSWVRQVYPDQIYSVASQTYNYLNTDNEIKKINVGYLMKKIMLDVFNMTEGNLNGEAKKMYLYSGHESTMGFLLYAMDLLKPHIPAYSSAIMIELYRSPKQETHETSDYYIKVKYRDSPVANSAIEFILPGCGGRTYCPLKKFFELQSHYLPSVSVEEACKLDKH